MQIVADRKLFLERFAAVAAVAPTRTPKPVLGNVLLTADAADGTVTLVACDLEKSLSRTLTVADGAHVHKGGKALLPAARVKQMLGAMTADTVTIEADGDSLIVRGDKSRFTLASEDPDTHPGMMGEPGTPAVLGLTGATLRTLIRRTGFATDVESVRYALGGCLVESVDGSVQFVATDGRRLARQTVETSGSDATVGSAVLPLAALKLAYGLAPDGDEPVTLRVGDSAASIECDGVRLLTRLADGRYPRYQDVFPRTPPTLTAECDAGPLLAAFEQASIATSEESRGVDCTFGAGTLTLEAKSADVGSSRIETPIACEGPEVVITFDPRYLTDALKAVRDTDRVRVELIDRKSAAVFKVGLDYSYVVMPLTRDV